MLSLDLRDFERAARNFDAALDQVPFALSQAMNDGVEYARNELITDTWPKSIRVRNRNFLGAALTTRDGRATKRNLRVAITDRLGRASLPLHAKGGTKLPKGSKLAVPSKAVAGRRGASGVPKGLRPRNVPNSFVKQSKFGPVLFQRTGTYHKVGSKGAKKAGADPGRGHDGRGLKLMYGLQSSVGINPDVPFEASFQRSFLIGMTRAFGPRIRAAMATRRG